MTLISLMLAIGISIWAIVCLAGILRDDSKLHYCPRCRRTWSDAGVITDDDPGPDAGIDYCPICESIIEGDIEPQGKP